MSEWRDISTAPRDGTKILGFEPDGLHGPTYAVIYWYTQEPFPGYEPAENGLFRQVFYGEAYSWWEGADYSPFNATHWMPLPEPPESK